MFVGVVKINVVIPLSLSLKEKRKVIKGIRDSILSRTGIKIVEVDGKEKWNFSTLGFAIVGSEKKEVDSELQKVMKIIEEKGTLEVVDKFVEYTKYE